MGVVKWYRNAVNGGSKDGWVAEAARKGVRGKPGLEHVIKVLGGKEPADGKGWEYGGNSEGRGRLQVRVEMMTVMMGGCRRDFGQLLTTHCCVSSMVSSGICGGT